MTDIGPTQNGLTPNPDEAESLPILHLTALPAGLAQIVAVKPAEWVELGQETSHVLSLNTADEFVSNSLTGGRNCLNR